MAQVTFVINLEHRTDRRAAMMRELARVGWQPEFFPAVRPDEPAGFPSVGARGCFLSHLAVLKEAQRTGMQRLIILEDDVNFVGNFSVRWDAALAALERCEWSICYPAHVLDTLPDGLSRLSPATGVRCTHFMLLNGKAIGTLVEGLEAILSRPPGHKLGGPMHVDGAYSTIRSQHPELVTYACAPVLGYQRSSRSDIANVSWYDRAPIIATATGYARRVKSGLSQIWN